MMDAHHCTSVQTHRMSPTKSEPVESEGSGHWACIGAGNRCTTECRVLIVGEAREGGVWGKPLYFSTWFCCEPKTGLKELSFLKITLLVRERLLSLKLGFQEELVGRRALGSSEQISGSWASGPPLKKPKKLTKAGASVLFLKAVV